MTHPDTNIGKPLFIPLKSKYFSILLAFNLFCASAHAEQVGNNLKDNLQAVKDVQLQMNEIRIYSGKQPIDFEEECKNHVGSGFYNIFIGDNAGTRSHGKCNILIGSFTNTPTPETDNFVNIGNKLCFDRVTGEKLKCPIR